MFDDEPCACFENDREQSLVFSDVLRQFDEDEAKITEAQLLKIWNAVGKTEKQIEEQFVQLPSHEALRRSIDEEMDQLKAAETDLKLAKEQHREALYNLWKKQKAIFISGNEDFPSPTSVHSAAEEKQLLRKLIVDKCKLLAQEKKRLNHKKASLRQLQNNN